MPDPAGDWQALNDRQLAYLAAIFERDQVKEKSARGAWLDRVRTSEHPPAANFVTFVWGGGYLRGDQYRLSEIGRQHYDLHWRCYWERYPAVAAAAPTDLTGAHAGMVDHQQRRRGALLSEQLWTVLAALARAEPEGNPVYEGRARAQHSHLILDRLPVPGLMEWQVARLARTSKAIERLRGHRAGALVDLVEVPNPQDLDYGKPLSIWRLTALGRRHYVEHLDNYRALHPFPTTPTPPAA